jgi:predicted AAA+ superfamily ATPase
MMEEENMLPPSNGGSSPSKSSGNHNNTQDTTAAVNPLKSDPELLSLLKKLDKVKKYKSFQRWKAKFLERFETFLYEAGMKPAELACNQISAVLNKFVKMANQVQTHISKGELSDSRKTVKAALALNEMCNDLTQVVTKVEDLVPPNSKEEKKRKFTKFHLGAALIRQGFH